MPEHTWLEAESGDECAGVQEELQREVARQFMAMRDGGWHVLDARQAEDALHAQARPWPARTPVRQHCGVAA